MVMYAYVLISVKFTNNLSEPQYLHYHNLWINIWHPFKNQGEFALIIGLHCFEKTQLVSTLAYLYLVNIIQMAMLQRLTYVPNSSWQGSVFI